MKRPEIRVPEVPIPSVQQSPLASAARPDSWLVVNPFMRTFAGLKLWQPSLLVVLALGLGAAGRTPAADTHVKLRVAAFSCDVTPPVGHPLCGGWIKPLEAIDDPLLAKGIVIADGRERFVLCAVDWCLLQTGAFDAFRRKIAAAAGVPESRVSVHTVHQHNAPIADADAQRLLDRALAAPPHLDLKFLDEVTDRLAVAVRDACGRLEPFNEIGVGRARVEKFASNRRVRRADGKVVARMSSTKDAAMRAEPEGLIDPWLRTVTFFDHQRPLVRLHFYASHPQSFYGDGRATSDTVGLARARFEAEERVPQVYFTGCAGNITAGKYNDGSPLARVELSGRIYAAMKQAASATARTAVTSLDWKTATVKFAPRTEPEWSVEQSRQIIADSNAPAIERLKAALNVAWRERIKVRSFVDVSRLRLGPANVLLLPGEAFVEYQLYAQSLRPDDFVAVAAYGESGPGYICMDAALTDGGYEPTFSRVGPPSEFRLKEAIADLLARGATQPSPPPYADKLHLLAWRDARGREHSITKATGWEKRRADILANMQLVMGPLPDKTRKVPLDVQVIGEFREPEFTRLKITFAPEAGDRMPAWLLIPTGLTGKAPAMLCLHQTTSIGKDEPVGLGGKTNLHYAAELARRGYVALAPDYPNFGEYRLDAYTRGYVSATMKGVWNHLRAVDVLAARREVDARRIGVIGHSLGGHNALLVAAFDPRLKAVVTSCGFNSFFKYKGGDLTGWSHAGYMPRIATVYGTDAKLMPFDFTEVLAAIAPRPVFINAPTNDDNFEVSGVKDCLAAAGPVYRLLDAEANLVAMHPTCGHDFPPSIRAKVYDWLAQAMR